MSTVYTKAHAIGRAVERAYADCDSYTVYQHRSGDNDFIVKNSAAALGTSDFRKVFTARCVDPSIAVLVEAF